MSIKYSITILDNINLHVIIYVLAAVSETNEIWIGMVLTSCLQFNRPLKPDDLITL